jgi:inositol transport system permease protein
MSESIATEEGLEREKRSTRWIELLEKFGVLFFLFVLIAFFAFQNQRFLSVRNIFNILADVSIYGVMAVGMTFVILTAGIDLSIGPLLAFCAMCGAAAVKGTGETRYAGASPHAFGGMSWLIALVICLFVGTAAGYLQGKASTKLRVPPFVVTLGGMTVWRGATLVIGGSSPFSGFDRGIGGGGAASFSVYLSHLYKNPARAGAREMTTEPVHLDHGQSPRREEADRYLMAQD